MSGDELGLRLHAEHRPVLQVRALRKTEVTISEVRSDHPTFERSDPLTPDDAITFAMQLRDFPVHEWWEDGVRAPTSSLRTGDMTIYDLGRDPRFTINAPFHSIHFRFPHRLFDVLAEENGDQAIGGFDYTPGQPIDDPVFRHLVFAIQPAFARPDEASTLFVDSVTLAVASHVTTHHGRARDRRQVGGLSGWQKRRCLECIDARLDGAITIAELAKSCGLSSSWFAEAFRRTMGMTPHRWVMRRRVEKAMSLLDGAMSQAEIALACGFANQSHFARVFRAHVGCAPGTWRRHQRA